MRGEFENIWKDAFDEASVTPSEKVWQGIANKMDHGSGKRSWVTLLLVAATITMAFAFPLTVGNSEYDFKPQMIEIADVNSQDKAVVEELVVTKDNSAETFAKTNDVSYSTTSAWEDNEIVDVNELTREKNSEVYREPAITLVEAEPNGDYSYQELQQVPGSLLDEYYLIPAYKKPNNLDSRSLLAYGNINSGRQSAISGLNSVEFLKNTADFENGPNLSNDGSANRSEDGGATFYIGIGAELPVSKRINLSFGLGYQNQRLNGTSNTIYEENGLQYPVGIYDPILPGTIFLTENYDYLSNNQFISIPVGAKYAIINKRVKLRLGLGVSPDFMISHKVSATNYVSRSTNISDTAYNPVQFTGLLNLDVLLPLRANYGLALETGLRQGMVPYVQSGSEYTTSFNFGVILFYQLKK